MFLGLSLIRTLSLFSHSWCYTWIRNPASNRRKSCPDLQGWMMMMLIVMMMMMMCWWYLFSIIVLFCRVGKVLRKRILPWPCFSLKLILPCVPWLWTCQTERLLTPFILQEEFSRLVSFFVSNCLLRFFLCFIVVFTVLSSFDCILFRDFVPFRLDFLISFFLWLSLSSLSCLFPFLFLSVFIVLAPTCPLSAQHPVLASWSLPRMESCLQWDVMGGRRSGCSGSCPSFPFWSCALSAEQQLAHQPC